MNMAKRFTLVRILIALVLTVLFTGSGYVLYEVGLYYSYLDNYSGHIERGDQTAARDGLKDLEYFYQLNRKLDALHLDWLGDKYLFYDSVYHRAAFNYIAGDYKKVASDLQDQDSFWAFYLRANANWRIAQGIYANGLNLPDKTDKDKAEKEKQLKSADDLAKTLVKDDYALSVRSDPSGSLPPSWNYDLVSNDSARKKGLQPKPGPIKVKLGNNPGGGSGPGLKGKDDDGKAATKPKDLDSKDGEKPGGKPGGKPRPRG